MKTFIQDALKHHFPIIRYVGNERQLWNPVLKKAYVARPEERVRLSLWEFFHHELAWSSNRVTFEAGLKDVHGRGAYRSDLVLYTASFSPLLLCECKAPQVALDEQAALQIARYNLDIKAPYLLLTNGHQLMLYVDKVGQAPEKLETWPDELQSRQEVDRTYPYWVDRGFLGADANPEIRKMLHRLVELTFVEHNAVQFISWGASAPIDEMDGFYAVVPVDATRKMAINLQNDAWGGQRLIAILSESGKNKGILEWYPILDWRATQPALFLTDQKKRRHLENQSLNALFQAELSLDVILSYITPLFHS